MPKEDLSQLASSGLPSLGGSFDNPTWSRSMQELKIASDSLWTQSAPSVLADPANSLLGARRLPELERMQRSEEKSSEPTQPSAETNFLKWEQSNKRREIDILKSIVQKAEAATRKKSQELYEKREQEDWEKKRDLWMKELVGTRNLGGSVVDENLASVGTTLLLENGGGPAGTPMLPASRPDQVRANHTAERFVDPQIVMSHLEIVKQLKVRGNFAEAANELAKVADSSSGASPGMTCYATALRLVSRILSRQNFSPVEVALATSGHFSGQFDEWMIAAIRKVGLEGQNQTQSLSTNVHNSRNANTVATFVSLELGATTETALWRCLYYCLRIGDAVAAKEIFQSTPAADESDESRAAIASILSALAQRQGGAASMWDALGPLVIPPQEARTLAVVYDMSKTSQSFFRTGVLALLSGAGELPSTSAAGFGTIEDYIFGLLWKALQNPNPALELENVGKTILKFGATYFDTDQNSGGWSYSLPLLAAQQFRTALSYLVQVGGGMGMLQATHLGLLMEASGAALKNLGESEHQASGSLLASLLVDYSSWLHAYPNSGAVCSLEYLKWIPNKNVMMDHVSALILQTQDIDVLAGKYANDGRRGKGALDNYFSEGDVSLLLKQAAENCYKGAKDRERQTRAAQLFMLAGDFKSLIVMLSTLMAPDMDVQNEDKRYWYDQSKGFQGTYLAKPTYVSEVLERNGQKDAVKTLEAMMELYEFFSFNFNGALNEAWSILTRLDILPQSEAEIGEKNIRFQGLDPLLQSRVPFLLLATMKSLYRQHAQLKQDMHSGSQNTVANAMGDLKSKAGVLLTFAGVIGSIAQDQMQELGQLEARLI